MATRTQRSRVADQLLHDIRAGRHPIGQKLPSERQLAEAFSVSRPVVREALGMLSSLDVVDIQVGRGAFVVANDVPPQLSERTRSLSDVNDAREAIEMGALRLAARRAKRTETSAVRRALRELGTRVHEQQETTEADHRLHRAIVAGARSPVLLEMWDELAGEILQAIRLSPRGRVMSPEIFAQHEVLASGVLDRRGSGEPLEAALGVCTLMHEDNRLFLQTMLP